MHESLQGESWTEHRWLPSYSRSLERALQHDRAQRRRAETPPEERLPVTGDGYRPRRPGWTRVFSWELAPDNEMVPEMRAGQLAVWVQEIRTPIVVTAEALR